MTYQELRTKHQNEVNAFSFGFAFGDKQFKEMMSKWGLDADNDEDLKKIAYLGIGGAYIRKSDIPAYTDWTKKKGFGTVVDKNGRERKAELHWYECQGMGKIDFKVKKWKDER